ncbi:Serine/threonine-protein kinase [Zea mays]|uniref:non-specific serine/threonine protein kinase n=1 Tax=Zea mays TaxID=4577 RepID=A0A1D6P507_MAIZE|nr:Serine/threonine-protein kinase [Zea mays]
MLSQHVLTLTIFLFFLVCFCHSLHDRLTSVTPLYPGDKLVSDNGGMFALGFFNLTTVNSTRSLYLGIWYNNIPERTYVWVANRNSPITTPSAKLVLTNTSRLVLSDSEGRVVWATDNSVVAGGSGTGTGGSGVLRSTGSFELELQLPNGTAGVVWKSLDHPTDTILPTFRLWTNYRAHTAVRVVAWKGPRDPSAGEFSLSGDPGSRGLQIVIWRGTGTGTAGGRSWRSGVWNGAGAFSSINRFVYSQVVDDGGTIYAAYNAAGGPTTHWKLDYTGNVSLRVWNVESSSWSVLFEGPGTGCLGYGACGPFGYCDATGRDGGVQECKCLDGFEPEDGFFRDFSRGCRRKEALQACGGGGEGGGGRRHYFLALPGMKVPDKFLYVRNRSFEECAAECDRNCSCTAYAYANLSGIVTMSATSDVSRCLLWMGELVDTGKDSDLGENLYLRLAGSPGNNNKKKIGSMAMEIVLPGTLEDGREVAVKRLSNGSEQDPALKSMLDWPKRGYMSPEYTMEGIFSVKSDTYSFGILLLEIVSGLKISAPPHLLTGYPSLIAYAWNLWKDGTAREFVDAMVVESRCSLDEALQCIHIGLLCVQDSPNDRPLMSLVVSMLNNEAAPRPVPSQPLFFAQRYHEALATRGDYSEHSANDVSLSMLQGR